MKRVFKTGVVAGAMLVGASAASASLVPVLTSITPGPGSNSTFNYDLVFATTTGAAPFEIIDSSANPIADFATIYDINGFVSAAAGTGWTAAFQNTGVTATGTAPVDSPSITNVTFSYAGPPATVTADTTFSGFSIVSSLSGALNGQFTSETTRGSGSLAGTALGQIGAVQVPGVPEPASAILFLGSGALLLFRRRD